MKDIRKWKGLNRRGLAALLTLAMCLGTVPFTAFAAEDTHEHNQNGWHCEWIEPEQELNCQHEHDEDCYVPGEPVLECTEDHHDEDCYVPGEDVLICENEDEDHEYDEDCYASGEAVLVCEEDHHTEDCYAPGEPVLDCQHEHGEECFSAAEGYWSCTPPVEDTADEADKDVVEEEDQFDNDDNQGAIVEDETFEDEDQTVIEDEDAFNDDEQQNDVEDEDEALVPEEVQAFLDAVAEIPEITPENAAEVAEYVYGEVSEYYEALLGTEYEDREDVQEAVAVYAAAIDEVDAALDMESNNFASPIWDTKNEQLGTVTKHVGEKGIYQRLPRLIRKCMLHQSVVLNLTIPDEDSYFLDMSTAVLGNPSILQDTGYIVGEYASQDPDEYGVYYYGDPCLEYDYIGKMPGSSTVNLTYYYTHDYDGRYRYCRYCNKNYWCQADYNTYYSYASFTVDIVADYVLHFDPNGGTDGPADQTVTVGTTSKSFTIPQTKPTNGNKTFLGWAEDPNATTATYTAGNSITLNWEDGFGSVDNPVSKTLYAVWGDDDTPTETTYKVVRKYYLDNELQGTMTVPTTDGVVGQEISGDDLAKANPKWTKYGPTGEEKLEYEYTGATPPILILVKDAAQNVITLRYDYTSPETYTVVYTDGSPDNVFEDYSKSGLKKGEATPTFKELSGKEQPEREGYEFMGWAPAVNSVVSKDDATNGVITYTATWQKKQLNEFKKELVENAADVPTGVTGITFPNSEGKVILPADGSEITLLYKITVTGVEGAQYEVEDKGATLVSGSSWSGTIPKSGEAVIYVTKSFTKDDISKDNNLVNTAKVTPGKGDESSSTATKATPAEVAENYTLTYDANGGTGGPGVVEQKDATFTISSTEPTKEGFKFMGWADTEDAKTASYQPKQTITLTEENPEKTLYAVWANKNDAGIKVTKIIQKQVKSEDSVAWTDPDGVGKLKNGDVVRYTVTVENIKNLPLKDLEFFDDMDVKLTDIEVTAVSDGWTAAYDYYPAEGDLKPLLYIAADGKTLQSRESIKVQYTATVSGVTGDENETVANYVEVYAQIDKDAYNQSGMRKAAAFRSSVNSGAGTTTDTGMSGNVSEGTGSGGRPTKPEDGIGGSGSTNTGTEKPVTPAPALSVTKTADKATASVGETITYTVTVENTGNVKLTGITVTDSMDDKVVLAEGSSFGLFDLAVGETKTITYTYTVTADDAGKDITNNVDVTSAEVTTPVTGSKTVTVKPVEPEKVTITIRYVNEANEIIDTFTEEVDKGSEYNVTDEVNTNVPEDYVIKGELPDNVTGIAKEDVTIIVPCLKDTATITYPGYKDGEEPESKGEEVASGTTIIVDPNGGLWTPPEGSEWNVEGDTFKHVAAAGEQIALTVPTKDGNVFVGWTKAEATDENGDKTITFTAQWVEADGRHTITVNRVHNGNTIVSIPVTVPDGEDYTVTDTDAPAAFDNGGNHYIRIDETLPTVTAGDENVSVDVRYALDNIGGGTNGNSPDGIPDDQQAVVYYRSSNTTYGTVRDAYQMFDLRPNVASRAETLRNAASTVGSGRFTNWTLGNQALSTSAALENVFTVEAGHTYTVIANFTSGNTGGGGSGGGGSSSGNTSNNTTNNNDSTTNDNTVTIDDGEVPLADLTSLNREDHFAYVSGYTDGTVRPTNNITREEVAAIFYRLLTDVSRTVYETGVNNFSDVDSSRWSNNAISTLANAGIISGYKEGTFKPGQTITRAEFAAIASRFDSVSENVTNPFTDTEGHWAEQLISNAADKGWVGGYPDNTFRPTNAITRAEAMTLINKVLNREVDEEGLLADAKQWPDNQKGKWYYYQVLEATNSHDYERRSADSYVENWTAITQK